MEKSDFVAYRALVTKTVEPFSEHALSPPTLSKGKCFGPRSLLLLGRCLAGGSLWKVPVEEQAHPCENGPRIHLQAGREGESSGDLMHAETACPTTSCGLPEVAVQPQPRGLCHRWGPPSHTRSRGQHCQGRTEAGVHPTTLALFHPFPPQMARRGPGIMWKGSENVEEVWAVPRSSPHLPQPLPSLGWGRKSWASAPILYTKHTKRIVTTTSINKVGQIQPWQKQEPFHWLQ